MKVQQYPRAAMASLTLVLSVVLLAAMASPKAALAQPDTGQQPQPKEVPDAAQQVVIISGAGMAEGIPGSRSRVTDATRGSYVIDAIIHQDGTASGDFLWVVSDLTMSVGEVHAGWLNGDGTATLTGVVYEMNLLRNRPVSPRSLPCPFSAAGLAPLAVPFDLTVFAGGPGEGGFLYWDGCHFAPGEFDSQIVVRGDISIDIIQSAE